jgi:glycerophosphoryl diester phosphodiesterase
MIRALAHLALILALSGCALQPATPPEAFNQPRPFALVPKDDLPDFFDCLRAEDAVILSGHRGGPVAGFPENALETMQATVSEIPALLEIDVSKTRDGVLVLMHDDTLDRTTTGSGKLADLDAADLAGLTLVDNDGTTTPYTIPTLSDALAWSEGRTLLALDRKGDTTYADLVAATKAHDAFGRVVFATYALDQAIEVAGLAPEAMIVVPLPGASDPATLAQAWVDLRKVVAWSGTEVPDPALYDRLAAEGIESAFAPLGAWTGSWDNRIRMLGDDSLYLRITRGVRLIATDRAREVAKVHTGVYRAAACVQ